MSRPLIRDHDKLGLCPVRELVRRVCPGPNERVGPSTSVADFDLVMRDRADRFDYLGRVRLIEAQLHHDLSPLKAISYAVADYALRQSPLAVVYDGAFLIHDYRDVPRPDDPRDAEQVRAWTAETFREGASINGERVELVELIQWLQHPTDRGPLSFDREHANIEGALRRV